MMKRLVLWVGGVLLGLVLLVVARLEWLDREGRARERETRMRTKVRIGDDQSTVRLRLGVPDTTESYKRAAMWHYRDFDGGPFTSLVLFDTSAVYFGDSVKAYIIYHKSSWWRPEDGLVASSYSNVDDVIARFEEALGPPCSTYLSEDSTEVSFLYRLSGAELEEDSIYRARSVAYLEASKRERVDASGDVGTIRRFLKIDLRKGKSVIGTGWTMGWCPSEAP